VLPTILRRSIPEIHIRYYSLGISAIKAGIAHLIQEVDYRMNNMESGFDARQRQETFFSLQHPDRLWGQNRLLKFLSGIHSLEIRLQGVKLTTHHHPVSSLEMPRAKICPFLCIEGVVLN
jgi:hypothetical protein